MNKSQIQSLMMGAALAVVGYALYKKSKAASAAQGVGASYGAYEGRDYLTEIESPDTFGTKGYW